MSKRKWQKAWATVVLVAICLIFLFETGVLPEGLYCESDSVQYALEILALILTLLGIVIGMKSEHRPALRLACFSVPLVFSLLVYYLFLSSTTLACAAAVGVAMLLQWPRAHTPEI